MKKLFAATEVSLLWEADGSTPKADSFDAIRSRVQAAIDKAVNTARSSCSDCCGSAYAWIMDLFPGSVVYSLDGNLYQCSYTDDGETSTLGAPVEVEMSYTAVPSDAQESHRILARESIRLQEASFDATAGSVKVKVIAPGMSKNRKNYSSEVLKRDHKIFKGAKMFADHQTVAESKARPEGSVNNWVANLTEVWAESDGTVMGRAVLIDPTFKAKITELDKQKLLSEMGLSIRAAGLGRTATDADGEFTEVTQFLAAKSVDFVTYAGAGGQVEAMESCHHDDDDVDVVTESDLRKRRPDLITLIESKVKKESVPVKTLEQQLQEANANLAASNTNLATEREAHKATQTKLEAAESTSKKATAAAELTKLLKESKLPEKAQDKLHTQFKEATSVDGMKEAVEAEKEYVKSLTGGSGVRNMGATESVSGERQPIAKEKIKESFMKHGLSEKEAAIAAGM